MPSEEEKEAAGHGIVDQGSCAQAPLSPDGAEPGGPEAGEEEKKRNYWWLSLGLMFLLLAGGGYYALTGMRQSANKLAGGSDYDQLSANSSVYDGGSAAVKNGNYFPLDEEAARAQTVPGGRSGRLNTSLVRARGELAADASRAGPGGAASVQTAEYPPSAENAARSPAASGGMAEKLQARAFRSGGPGEKPSKSSSPAVTIAPLQGGAAAVAIRASEQRETKGADPKQAGRGSVMESLKGAFKATFYGARLSSHDSAKTWIARSFDGAPEATTAIQYEEKMRTQLDKVNPDSIPGFLREQDVNAAEAKSLETPDVAKPKIDKEDTKEALAEDKKYQARKLANDFSGSMLNGLFAGISGTGSPGNGDNPDEYADPDAPADLNGAGLFNTGSGNGEECGCSAEAPCCCMPPGGFGDPETDNFDLWAGPDTGDFSMSGDGYAFA